MGWYRDGTFRDDSNDIFSNIMTGTQGVVGGQGPFVNPYSTTVPDVGGGGIGSALLDMVMMNTLGIKNPFRIPSWSEPAAGKLGAYAYGRFSANSARMGAAVALQKSMSRKAFGQVIAYNPVSEILYNGDTAGQRKLARAVEAGDAAGFTDLGAGLLQQFFGLEDFGVAGIRAAQRAESMLGGRMQSSGAGELLRGESPVSSAWSSRRAAVVGEYARAANKAMYKDGTYIRNEDFMRGFSETDVSSVLERVAASAKSNEDLGARFQSIGKEAMKTLEAFRDLFGSADAAKRMLNQVTGGGWSNMKAEDLQNITNRLRGLQSLGEIAGLSPDQVGNMLLTGQAAVQGAMGYTKSDIAGGYVNQAFVGGITEAILAKEMANMDPSQLDPATVQRMRARATYQATQFAGSSAARAMTAFEFAVQQGNIVEGSDDYNRIKKLFESGDTKNMGQAAEMVAKAMNISMEELYSDSNFKLFADSVGSDQKRLEEFMDIGSKAMGNENRITMEKQMSDTGLDMAIRYAKDSGLSRDDAISQARKSRMDYIVKSLSENQDMKGVSGLLKMVQAEREKNGDAAAYALFEKYSSDIENTEFAATLKTNAQATAANSVVDYADRVGNRTRLAGVNLGQNLTEILDKKNVDLSGGIRMSDASKILTSYGERVGGELKKKIDQAVKNGNQEEIQRALQWVVDNGDGEILENSVRNTVFDVKPPKVELSAKMTSNQLASELRKSPVDGESSTLTVDRLYTNGAGGVLSEEKAGSTLSTIVGHAGVLAEGLKDDKKKEAFQEKLADIQNSIDKGDISRAARAFEALRKDEEYKDVFDEGSAVYKKFRSLTSKDLAGDKDFAGVTADDFVKGLASKRSYADVVKIGGRRYRMDELNKVVSKAAEGIDYTNEKGDVKSLSDLEGADLYKEIARLQKVAAEGGEKGEDAQNTLNRLYSNVAKTGEMVTGESLADIGGVLGKVATGELIDSGYGGELAAADLFNKAVQGLSNEVDTTTNELKRLGKAISDIVDKNAGAAYNTMQQGLLKGLSGQGWDSFLDMIMKPNMSKEEKEKAISTIEDVFNKHDVLKKDENGKVVGFNFEKMGEAISEVGTKLGLEGDKLAELGVEKTEDKSEDKGNGAGASGGEKSSNAATETTLKEVAEAVKGGNKILEGIKGEMKKAGAAGGDSNGKAPKADGAQPDTSGDG